VLGGLPVLGSERADRVHVHQAVGHVPRHARDRFLALVDELLTTADQRCDTGPVIAISR
jgi:hypothetical protein